MGFLGLDFGHFSAARRGLVWDDTPFCALRGRSAFSGSLERFMALLRKGEGEGEGGVDMNEMKDLLIRLSA
tara:strand:+ start:46002 stop:46214 length:213 start_codon:yes stop_codon:yes gene_type:complete